MHYSWIIDVLQDLQAFARTNGMAELAAQLDNTSKLAEVEIAQLISSPSGGVTVGDGSAAAADHRGFAERLHAW